MDPIKVDFSGSGSKKSGSVIIPPNKAGLKILINILGTAIVAAVAYYFYLPAFNFKAIEMYIYFGMVIAAYCVMAFITSGALMSPEYTPYARKNARIPIIIAVVLLVVVGIGYLVSSVFFRAKDYHEILPVETADFSEDVQEADFASVPLLDKDSAATLASKALSDLVDENLVSQFTINSSETQINLNNRPVRISTLKYQNIIKWLTNRSEGLPGYLVIDMTTQKVNFVRVENGIKYSDADHFNRLLKRHLRFNYPTALLGTSVFEVDENGNPYWICPILDNTIGLFGGKDVKGAILVNPSTGECSDYTIDEIRSSKELNWIDRVYSPDLLVDQYDYYGKYEGGFWNSILGQKNVVVTTSGYNYLALNDDVYMYTGVTSITSTDNSITGFTLINQRTKEAKFYRVNGATENAAQEAAQGKVQQYQYVATFPLLLNIGEQPTYFMALKDNNQIVQQYALVNVNQFTTLVSTGTSIAVCLENYTKLLAENGIETEIDVSDIEDNLQNSENSQTTAELKELAGAIEDIRVAVIGGNSCYYLKVAGSDKYFAVSASKFETVVIADKGDSVTLKYADGDAAIIEVKDFKLG